MVNSVPLLCLLSAIAFLFLHRLYSEDPATSIEQCQSLLEEPQLDAAVRVGDVLGLLVSHHAHVGNFSKVS